MILTMKQAWRLIAREFEKVAQGETSEIAQLGSMNVGLCIALSALRNRGKISELMRVVMRVQLDETFGESRGFCYWWSLDRKGAADRVVAATLMAEGVTV